MANFTVVHNSFSTVFTLAHKISKRINDMKKRKLFSFQCMHPKIIKENINFIRFVEKEQPIGSYKKNSYLALGINRLDRYLF